VTWRAFCSVTVRLTSSSSEGTKGAEAIESQSTMSQKSCVQSACHTLMRWSQPTASQTVVASGYCGCTRSASYSCHQARHRQ